MSSAETRRSAVLRTVPHDVQTDLQDPSQKLQEKGHTNQVSTQVQRKASPETQLCDISSNLQKSVAITSSARFFKENFRVTLGDGCQCCLLFLLLNAMLCKAEHRASTLFWKRMTPPTLTWHALFTWQEESSSWYAQVKENSQGGRGLVLPVGTSS